MCHNNPPQLTAFGRDFKLRGYVLAEGSANDGALGHDVAGVGGYSLWNNHLYMDVTVYRSEHAGASTPITGIGNSTNISGVAPYWRVAWQQNWGSNYLEVGSYGIYVNSFPNAITGPEDRYLDAAFDFQYERPGGGGGRAEVILEIQRLCLSAPE